MVCIGQNSSSVKISGQHSSWASTRVRRHFLCLTQNIPTGWNSRAMERVVRRSSSPSSWLCFSAWNFLHLQRVSRKTPGQTVLFNYILSFMFSIKILQKHNLADFTTISLLETTQQFGTLKTLPVIKFLNLIIYNFKNDSP